MQNDMTTITNEEFSKPNKVVLPVINPIQNPEVLIFDLNDIKYLRDLKILGTLIGTLQNFPQQNLFLSIPLKINVYDVIWLVKYDHGVLVDQLAYRNERRLKTTTKSKNLNHNGSVILIPSTESDRDWDLINKNKLSIKQYLHSYLHTQTNKSNISRYFHYYNFLINQGFYINPGLKFGGDFVIYPGDPLRYHSYSTIKFEFIDCYEIISGGRLATSVKKNLILMGERNKSSKVEEKDDKEVVVDDDFIEELFDDEVPLCFSIEWAGFG
ncbi:SEN34 [Candida jiufengensis]|uniref:SEN34 n=1 Tax=Candida jiufengensis TaxID=497108 RepID=UPI002223F6C8|nr:SEN34 [Candida jiufengensis]KAI5951870.1 SEN34 [Candida jiufengensis]